MTDRQHREAAKRRKAAEPANPRGAVRRPIRDASQNRPSEKRDDDPPQEG